MGAPARRPRVGVIGAGPGGIAMGIQLARAGYDFTIFERGDGFGGTWRNNTYPGAACDVPSHFYSFSFALNPYWSKTFANQPEILAYLEKVAEDHGLGPHLRANTSVTELRWSDADSRWTIDTEHGDRHEVDIVVSAVGMLDVPNIPDIPGRERFGGRVFHSSRWDHSTSTAGERVASIGTGASAVQYVPAIAAETEHLTIFQRTPIWVAPRIDDPFTTEQQELFANDPAEALKALGGAAVVLATAGNSSAMAATVGGISPKGELVTVGVTPEPLPISPIQLITPGVSIVGHPSGTAKEIEDTMHFALLSGVRAWIEELPLSQAAEGYATLEQGRAHYRTVLTM